MKVYFDNASTTQVHPKVLEAMLPYLQDNFGNASSIHSHGRKARVAIEEARETIADFIGAIPSEIYFTSGGTEAINFIINGIAKTNFSETGKNQILTTKIEHKAVLDTYYDLSENGFNSAFIEVNDDGSYNPISLVEKFSYDTSLLSIMHTNNELGTINKIKEVSDHLLDDQYLFCDAVQAFGKIDLDVNLLKVNALSGSAHKIYGPKGVGFAYVRSGTPISPLLFGGNQERNRRGGTENIAAIVGFAEAVNIIGRNMGDHFKKVAALNKYCKESISQIFGNKIEFNGGNNTSPYILSFTFKDEYFNNDGEALLMGLDINGIAASQGSACTSGTIKPSHVILGIGKKKEDANGTLRISFNSNNTNEEIDYLISVLEKIGMQNLKT